MGTGGVMKVLIAEDDVTSRRLLEVSLSRSGYDVVAVADGNGAWEVLQGNDPPRLVILDWMMPGKDGIDICRRLRDRPDDKYIYVMLVTTKTKTEDIVAGLEAGADDYLTKPYDPHELRCRVKNGERILGLESALATKIQELQEASSHVKQLQGLLPICMYCKKIRDDSDTWHRLETYIEHNSEAMFSHSLCEECRHEHFPKVASEPVGR
jgi:sigma-B regulation protein RsbU (phosphoserine phosphatase)